MYLSAENYSLSNKKTESVTGKSSTTDIVFLKEQLNSQHQENVKDVIVITNDGK